MRAVEMHEESTHLNLVSQDWHLGYLHHGVLGNLLDVKGVGMALQDDSVAAGSQT
jgi:hypothetical protein